MRTVRFYSDAGVVSESARSAAGYRLYDGEAVIRLGLVRTLRGLGVPLETIRAVLTERTSLGQVAMAHVDTPRRQPSCTSSSPCPSPNGNG